MGDVERAAPAAPDRKVSLRPFLQRDSTVIGFLDERQQFPRFGKVNQISIGPSCASLKLEGSNQGMDFLVQEEAKRCRFESSAIFVSVGMSKLETVNNVKSRGICHVVYASNINKSRTKRCLLRHSGKVYSHGRFHSSKASNHTAITSSNNKGGKKVVGVGLKAAIIYGTPLVTRLLVQSIKFARPHTGSKALGKKSEHVSCSMFFYA
ncbi:hypothetical protein BDR22DRAFT_821417 [Usnea florida]